MSTRSSLGPELGSLYREAVCSVCGSREWTAVWRGEEEIFVCRDCAVTVLPRLIADATWRDATQPTWCESTLERVRSEFWRAIAINWWRKSS